MEEIVETRVLGDVLEVRVTNDNGFSIHLIKPKNCDFLNYDQSGQVWGSAMGRGFHMCVEPKFAKEVWDKIISMME